MVKPATAAVAGFGAGVAGGFIAGVLVGPSLTQKLGPPTNVQAVASQFTAVDAGSIPMQLKFLEETTLAWTGGTLTKEYQFAFFIANDPFATPPVLSGLNDVELFMGIIDDVPNNRWLVEFSRQTTDQVQISRNGTQVINFPFLPLDLTGTPSAGYAELAVAK